MKRIFCLIFFFFAITIVVYAQNNYFTHTLVAGETLSSLAKKYNTTVGDIMRLNGMNTNSKLVYGSEIKIPGTAEMPAPPAIKQVTKIYTAQIISLPETRTVIKGESLFGISKQYNLPIDSIKAWNNLSSNNLSVGTVLVLKKTDNNNAIQITKPEVDTQPSDNDEPQTVKQKKQKIKSEPIEQQPESFPVLTYLGNGFFEKEFYGEHGNSVSGQAMYFKSLSGWNDGKFYILMNEADAGKVVKVSAANGNYIYAKVLMPMDNELKENKGLNFRISNAAAAALGITDAKFNLSISW